MNRAARQKNERRIEAKKEKVLSTIRVLLYVLGFLFFIYTMRAYNFTFIKLRTIFFIGMMPAFLCAVLLKVKLKEYIFTLLLWGMFFAGLFFCINSFSSETPEKVKMSILDRWKGGSKSSPHVAVEYNGIERNISVDTTTTHPFSAAPYLLVTIKKGCLGYYTVEDRELAMK